MPTIEKPAEIQENATDGLVDFLSSDENKSSSNSASDVQPDASQPTPDGQQGEDSKGANQPSPAKDAEAKSGKPDAASKDEGENKQPSEEEIAQKIREELGLKAQEPETLATVKQRYAESSRQAKILAQKVQGYESALLSQGLKPVVTTGEKGKPVVALLADEKYVQQKLDDANISTRKLTASEAQEAVEDPEAFAQKMYSEGARRGIEAATKSPVPTITADEVQLPSELLQLYREEVVQAAKPNGDPVHPDFKTFEPYIDQVIKELPDGLTNLMTKDPDIYKTVVSLAYSRVAHKAAPIIAANRDAAEQAAKRTKLAKDDVSLSSAGTPVGTPASKEQAAMDEVEEILTATPQY